MKNYEYDRNELRAHAQPSSSCMHLTSVAVSTTAVRYDGATQHSTAAHRTVQ